MRASHDRILTTHVGSLPRNPTLTDLLIRQEAGEKIDISALDREAAAAVQDVVTQQVAAGIDVINDGEQPRVGFQTYISARMRGFGGESKRKRPLDYVNFPGFAQQAARRFAGRSKVANAPQAVAEVQYTDMLPAERECDLFDRAVAHLDTTPIDRFMTAASPGIIATTMVNAHYDSQERYVFALAREMRKEYELIAARGYVLQIDAPDLAMERTMMYQDRPLREFLSVVEMHIAALNVALAGIPADRVRLHCCWGNWEGPHVHDVPLGEILRLLYGARIGALSLEFANPRHQHEYQTLRDIPLPSSIMLLPGVIDSTTNYVEHPQVIANRIAEAVAAVGDRERIVASTDCGFGTFAGYEFCSEDIVWMKLRALREGADLASRKIWGRPA